MTRSTGCVHSVATAPDAQPATKSAVFSAIKPSLAVAARRLEQRVKARTHADANKGVTSVFFAG